MAGVPTVDGFLARVYCAPAPADFSSAVPPPDDLLLALTASSLRVFARQARDPGCACLSDAGDALLARGLHCPHVRGAGDFWPTGLIVAPAAVRQVLVTYRSVGDADARPEARASGVAARTRDCVLVLAANEAQQAQTRRVRLEFEHNLARGAFVDALTVATGGQVEVDYMDALELEDASVDGHEDVYGISLRGNIRSEDSIGPSVLEERRSALRAVVAGKISLALQLAREQYQTPAPAAAGGGPSIVHLLLGSATALAQALDEPDELALAWLVSGFINAQYAKPSARVSAQRAKQTAALALAQLQHAAKLAREDSLALLLSLALQCSADLLVAPTAAIEASVEGSRGSPTRSNRWRLEAARQWLAEAARLLPRDGNAGLKMQLHRKVGDLSAILSARLSGDANESCEASRGSERERGVVRESHADLATRALDLWALLLDTGEAPAQQLGGLSWLLSPPLKRVDEHDEPSAVCVHVLNPFPAPVEAATTAVACTAAQIQRTDMQRLRVFFTAERDVGWLQTELTRRLRECPPPFEPPSDEYRASSGSGDGGLALRSLAVCALFDGTNGGKHHAEALPLAMKLRAVAAASDGRTLTAQVTIEEWAAREDQRALDSPTVLCSHCHVRVLLDDAEAHSETCC